MWVDSQRLDFNPYHLMPILPLSRLNHIFLLRSYKKFQFPSQPKAVPDHAAHGTALVKALIHLVTQ